MWLVLYRWVTYLKHIQLFLVIVFYNTYNIECGINMMIIQSCFKSIQLVVISKIVVIVAVYNYCIIF